MEKVAVKDHVASECVGGISNISYWVTTGNRIHESIMPIPNLIPKLISSVVFLLGHWGHREVKNLVGVHVLMIRVIPDEFQGKGKKVSKNLPRM
jgi:hypothetical protein